MRKLIIIILICAGAKDLNAQTISQKIAAAYKQFESDPQVKHAITSLYVIDATGKVIFDKNSQIGLAPASSQKIITAATSFELLGKDYRYKTELGYDGEITKEGFLDGDFYIYGNGDPTLGSWRYGSTKEDSVFRIFAKEIEKKGLNKIAGEFKAISIGWESNYFPDGWIWQDIGNYYGAGCRGINWRENQFDIVLESGEKINEGVSIKSVNPKLYQTHFISEIKSAAKKSGDNAYVYQPINSVKSYLRGTIPAGEKKFKISGAMSDPSKELEYSFAKYLSVKNSLTYNVEFISNIERPAADKKENIFFTHYSPSLDSIIYWFLKKSINLYGEALIKTMAYEKRGFGATDTGINIVKDFWKQKVSTRMN